jgi:hypothetical protein
LWVSENDMGIWYRKFVQESEEKPVSAEQVLRTLGERWRGATTLEYRSRLTLSRPNLARIEVKVDNPEFCCLRVCDGRVIWQRNQSVPLRPARTQTQRFSATVMAGILHPLDEAAYSVDQFLAPLPFWLPRREGHEVTRTAKRRKEKGRELFIVTQSQDTSVDTLTLDAKTYAPIRLVRVGDHGGVVQELLREEFQSVVFGGALPSPLFHWGKEDEART